MRNLLSGLPGALGVTLVGVLGCAADHKAREAVDASAAAADAEPTATPEAGESVSEGDAGASDRPEAGASDQPDAAAAAGDSGGPTQSSCDPLILPATPAVPEVMIVLDRSQSMAPGVAAGVSCVGVDFLTDQTNCTIGDQAACDRLACLGIDCAAPPYQGTTVCGGTSPSPAVDRWSQAVQGLDRVTQQFQAELSFGLTLFPGEMGATSGVGGGGDVCAPGKVRVPGGPSSAAAIAQALKATQPSGATPLASALTAVLDHLRARPGAPPPSYLLLLTDGQPTCPNAGGNTLNAAALAQDLGLALQALDALRAADVKTFVFGFITPSETALATALGELAVHGGTDQFHRVQDAQSIVDRFAMIAPSIGAAAACSVLLERERDARYLSVQLDGLGLEPDAEGWLLEGATLTLQGAACDAFSDGGKHQLVVREWCEPLDR